MKTFKEFTNEAKMIGDFKSGDKVKVIGGPKILHYTITGEASAPMLRFSADDRKYKRYNTKEGKIISAKYIVK